MKTKREILLANGYTSIIGYVLDYEKGDLQNVIISREDVERFFCETPTEMFFEEDDEYAVELDDAWESFTDNYLCDHDLDEIDDEELIKLLSEKIEVR